MKKNKHKKEEPKKEKMRMLWSTNAPWSNSGYAVQASELINRMIAKGYPIAMSCFYGLEGGILNVNGITCYPKMGQTYGGDACYHHQKDFRADVLITFQDVWPIDPQPFYQCKKWIAWVPIDHDPAPAAVVEKLKHAYRIVTLCKFGQKALEKAGLMSTLIEEGVDTNIFKPMDKKESRKMMGLPEDMFLFGMVAANKDNPPRKSFQQCMDAFLKFKNNHPDLTTGMYFQTLLQQDGGFDIQGYAKYLGIEKNVFFPPPYQLLFHSLHPQIARIMNSFDVLLNPSLNEGFGLPIIEAQAVGVPVIVNNFTSMPELVIPGKTGEICDIAFKRWTPIRGYTAFPDVNSIYGKMEKIFKADRIQMAKDCRDHIVKNYDLDTIFNTAWLPFLEQVEKEVCK